MLCPNGAGTTLESALDNLYDLYPESTQPNIMGDQAGGTREVSTDDPDQAIYMKVAVGSPGYNSGDAGMHEVMLLYLLREAYDAHPEVRDLYADMFNEETVSREQYHPYLHYPPGSATAYDEFASRLSLGFDLRGSERLDLVGTISGRNGNNPLKLMVLRAGHLEIMVPAVCQVLP